jgi:hypothetical protein
MEDVAMRKIDTVGFREVGPSASRDANSSNGGHFDIGAAGDQAASARHEMKPEAEMAGRRSSILEARWPRVFPGL